MGLPSNRIRYAIGSAGWGLKAAAEGIPVLEHTEPEIVIDQSSAPVIAKSQRLPDGQDTKIGNLYYAWNLPLLFAQAHTRLILDKFFESTVPGAGPNYTRTYQAEDIKADPVTPFANLWKKTAKPSHDHNLCCYNGIVTGIGLSKSPGQPVRLTPRYAFGARSFTEPDPGGSAWTVDRTTGNFVPPAEGDRKSVV